LMIYLILAKFPHIRKCNEKKNNTPHTLPARQKNHVVIKQEYLLSNN
jgi:hypothetical protein